MDEMPLDHLDAERSTMAMLAVARYYIRTQPHTCEDPGICCAACVTDDVVKAGATGVNPLWAQDG